MKIVNTEIPEVLIIEPEVFGDHRGWFMESWSASKMNAAGLEYNFVQDNLHFLRKRVY